jgi:hypothetical protein
MSNGTTVVDVELPSGRQIAVRAVDLGGAQDVGMLDRLDFANVTQTIEDIAQAIGDTLDRITPKAATVSFGVEVAVKSGKLVSLLAEGGGTATLTVTLEWGA